MTIPLNVDDGLCGMSKLPEKSHAFLEERYELRERHDEWRSLARNLDCDYQIHQQPSPKQIDPSTTTVYGRNTKLREGTAPQTVPLLANSGT